MQNRSAASMSTPTTTRIMRFLLIYHHLFGYYHFSPPRSTACCGRGAAVLYCTQEFSGGGSYETHLVRTFLLHAGVARGQGRVRPLCRRFPARTEAAAAGGG